MKTFIEKEKEETEETLPVQSDSEIVKEVLRIRDESQAVRDIFLPLWKLILEQLSGKLPAKYDKKKKWQSKAFIEEQSKIFETAYEMQKEVQFKNIRFYDIAGIKEEERAKANDIMELMDAVFRIGKFFKYNGFTQAEAGKLGASFLMVLGKENKQGLKFEWVSVKDAFPDFSAIVNFEEGRYFGRQAHVPVYQIIESDLYSSQKKKELLQSIGVKGEFSGREESDSLADKEKNIFPRKSETYQTVKILEFYLQLPVYKYFTLEDGTQEKYQSVEWRVVTIANDKVLLRNDENIYGGIPAVMSRIGRMQYHLFGRGYLAKTVGLQAYLNDFINIALDRLKKGSFPPFFIEKDAVPKGKKINLGANAYNELEKGGTGKMHLQAMANSNVGDIIQGLVYLGSKMEEVSRINKGASGGTTIQGNKETLGEFTRKLEAGSRHIVTLAMENDEDYTVPLLNLVFKFLTNPQIVEQNFADRILGMQEVERMIENPQAGFPIIDIQTGQPLIVKGKEPKLVLEELGDVELDFIATGVTQFIQQLEKELKMEKLMDRAEKSPKLSEYVHYSELVKRYVQNQDLRDSEKILKSDEERQEIEKEAAIRIELAKILAQEGIKPGVSDLRGAA